MTDKELTTAVADYAEQQWIESVVEDIKVHPEDYDGNWITNGINNAVEKTQ